VAQCYKELNEGKWWQIVLTDALVYRRAAQVPGSVLKKNKRPPIRPTSKTETSQGTIAERHFRQPGPC
jgi:hypothetical protein